MDRTLKNEISVRNKEDANNINEFINELKNVLDDPKNRITIDKSFYNEIYNNVKLSQKYKNQLEDIIKKCLLEYSYETDYIYVNYDEKSRKYYMDIYDEDVIKVNVNKKDLDEANLKVGKFYYQMNDFNYFEEYKNIKKQLKKQIEFELKKLENSRRINE